MAKGSTTAKVKAKEYESPSVAWDRAFEKALSQLSTHVGTGQYSVRVEFSADVTVKNPGVVGWYKVKLITP
jgi:hypothetical protein